LLITRQHFTQFVSLVSYLQLVARINTLYFNVRKGLYNMLLCVYKRMSLPSNLRLLREHHLKFE